MKKIKKSIFLIITVLLINAVTFAQIFEPADFGGDGTANPLDEPAATKIDENLWILLIIGLVYIFFVVKKWGQKIGLKC